MTMANEMILDATIFEFCESSPQLSTGPPAAALEVEPTPTLRLCDADRPAGDILEPPRKVAGWLPPMRMRGVSRRGPGTMNADHKRRRGFQRCAAFLTLMSHELPARVECDRSPKNQSGTVCALVLTLVVKAQRFRPVTMIIEHSVYCNTSATCACDC
jgi:hypothetical protein